MGGTRRDALHWWRMTWAETRYPPNITSADADVKPTNTWRVRRVCFFFGTDTSSDYFVASTLVDGGTSPLMATARQNCRCVLPLYNSFAGNRKGRAIFCAANFFVRDI